VLKEKGIITDSDYWVNNAVPGRIVRGEFAAALIKRAASILKDKVYKIAMQPWTKCSGLLFLNVKNVNFPMKKMP